VGQDSTPNSLPLRRGRYPEPQTPKPSYVQIAPEPEAVKKAVERSKSRKQEAAEKRAAGRGRPQPPRPSVPERDEEIDDDDLLASTSHLGKPLHPSSWGSESSYHLQ